MIAHTGAARAVALVVLGAVAVAASACGGKSPGLAPPPSPVPVATPVPFTPVPARPTLIPRAAPEGLKRGGVLRFAVAEPPPHLDPHQTVSPALATWGPGITYSRLFRFATGPGAPFPSGEIECDLCETWEMPDALTLRVTLRPGARWQDIPPVSGRPVTAQDIVSSYRRQATPGWPNAPLLSNVADVAAEGESRIVIKLRSPDVEALENLADAHSRIVAEEAVTRDGGLLRGPVAGSGPWVLEASDSDGASYTANLGYYEHGVPYLSGLEVRVIPDAGTRVAAVRNRLLDLDQAPFRDAKEAVAAFPALTITRVLEPGAGVEVGLNASRPPLDSVEARQTLLKTLDPWGAIDAVWDGEGAVSSGLPVPDASWLLGEREMRAYFLPPGAAALRGAQPPGGAGRIQIKAGEFSPRYVLTAGALAEQLGAAGYDVELLLVTTRDFAEKVWLGGDYQLFVGAAPPVSGLSSYLYSVFHSRGKWNTAGYSSLLLDQLIEEQAVEYSPVARRELVLRIQREIMGAALRFQPVTRISHWMSWDYVHGFAPNLYRGESHWLTQIWLDR